MIKKEITIHALNEQRESVEKTITLGYCYATEIAYKNLSGEDILDFIREVIETIQEKDEAKKKSFDTQKAIYFVIASAISYYNSLGEDVPIVDKDLMYGAQRDELGKAVGTIVGMRVEFYSMPDGEPKEKPKGGEQEKNA